MQRGQLVEDFATNKSYRLSSPSPANSWFAAPVIDHFNSQVRKGNESQYFDEPRIRGGPPGGSSRQGSHSIGQGHPVAIPMSAASSGVRKPAESGGGVGTATAGGGGGGGAPSGSQDSIDADIAALKEKAKQLAKEMERRDRAKREKEQGQGKKHKHRSKSRERARDKDKDKEKEKEKEKEKDRERRHKSKEKEKEKERDNKKPTHSSSKPRSKPVESGKRNKETPQSQPQSQSAVEPPKSTSAPAPAPGLAPTPNLLKLQLGSGPLHPGVNPHSPHNLVAPGANFATQSTNSLPANAYHHRSPAVRSPAPYPYGDNDKDGDDDDRSVTPTPNTEMPSPLNGFGYHTQFYDGLPPPPPPDQQQHSHPQFQSNPNFFSEPEQLVDPPQTHVHRRHGQSSHSSDSFGSVLPDSQQQFMNTNRPEARYSQVSAQSGRLRPMVGVVPNPKDSMASFYIDPPTDQGDHGHSSNRHDQPHPLAQPPINARLSPAPSTSRHPHPPQLGSNGSSGSKKMVLPEYDMLYPEYSEETGRVHPSASVVDLKNAAANVAAEGPSPSPMMPPVPLKVDTDSVLLGVGGHAHHGSRQASVHGEVTPSDAAPFLQRTPSDGLPPPLTGKTGDGDGDGDGGWPSSRVSALLRVPNQLLVQLLLKTEEERDAYRKNYEGFVEKLKGIDESGGERGPASLVVAVRDKETGQNQLILKSESVISEQYTRKIAALENKLAHLSESHAKSTSARKKYQAKVSSLEIELATVGSVSTSQKGEIASLSGALKETKNQLAAKRKENLDLVQGVADLQAMHEKLKSEHALDKLELENARREWQRGLEVVRHLEDEIQELKEEVVKKKGELRKVKDEAFKRVAKEEGRREGFEEGVRRGRVGVVLGALANQAAAKPEDGLAKEEEERKKRKEKEREKREKEKRERERRDMEERLEAERREKESLKKHLEEIQRQTDERLKQIQSINDERIAELLAANDERVAQLELVNESRLLAIEKEHHHEMGDLERSMMERIREMEKSMQSEMGSAVSKLRELEAEREEEILMRERMQREYEDRLERERREREREREERERLEREKQEERERLEREERARQEQEQRDKEKAEQEAKEKEEKEREAKEKEEKDKKEREELERQREELRKKELDLQEQHDRNVRAELESRNKPKEPLRYLPMPAPPQSVPVIPRAPSSMGMPVPGVPSSLGIPLNQMPTHGGPSSIGVPQVQMPVPGSSSIGVPQAQMPAPGSSSMGIPQAQMPAPYTGGVPRTASSSRGHNHRKRDSGSDTSDMMGFDMLTFPNPSVPGYGNIDVGAALSSAGGPPSAGPYSATSSAGGYPYAGFDAAGRPGLSPITEDTRSHVGAGGMNSTDSSPATIMHPALYGHPKTGYTGYPSGVVTGGQPHPVPTGGYPPPPPGTYGNPAQGLYGRPGAYTPAQNIGANGFLAAPNANTGVRPGGGLKHHSSSSTVDINVVPPSRSSSASPHMPYTPSHPSYLSPHTQAGSSPVRPPPAMPNPTVPQIVPSSPALGTYEPVIPTAMGRGGPYDNPTIAAPPVTMPEPTVDGKVRRKKAREAVGKSSIGPAAVPMPEPSSTIGQSAGAAMPDVEVPTIVPPVRPGTASSQHTSGHAWTPRSRPGTAMSGGVAMPAPVVPNIVPPPRTGSAFSPGGAGAGVYSPNVGGGGGSSIGQATFQMPQPGGVSPNINAGGEIRISIPEPSVPEIVPSSRKKKGKNRLGAEPEPEPELGYVGGERSTLAANAGMGMPSPSLGGGGGGAGTPAMGMGMTMPEPSVTDYTGGTGLTRTPSQAGRSPALGGGHNRSPAMHTSSSLTPNSARPGMMTMTMPEASDYLDPPHHPPGQRVGGKAKSKNKGRKVAISPMVQTMGLEEEEGEEEGEEEFIPPLSALSASNDDGPPPPPAGGGGGSGGSGWGWGNQLKSAASGWGMGIPNVFGGGGSAGSAAGVGGGGGGTFGGAPISPHMAPGGMPSPHIPASSPVIPGGMGIYGNPTSAGAGGGMGMGMGMQPHHDVPIGMPAPVVPMQPPGHEEGDTEDDPGNDIDPQTAMNTHMNSKTSFAVETTKKPKKKKKGGR